MADEAALFDTMGLRDDDRLLAALPLSHSYGLTTLALSSLIRGLTLVLPSEHGPFAALEAARPLDATFFPTVPAHLDALVKMSEPPPRPAACGSSSPRARSSPPPPRRRSERPTASVHVFYGSSECGGICYDREGGAAERDSVGTPVRACASPWTSSRNGGNGGDSSSSSRRGRRRLPPRSERPAETGRSESHDLASGGAANWSCWGAPIASSTSAATRSTRPKWSACWPRCTASTRPRWSAWPAPGRPEKSSGPSSPAVRTARLRGGRRVVPDAPGAAQGAAQHRHRRRPSLHRARQDRSRRAAQSP